jgi:chromosome segregation ATPase
VTRWDFLKYYIDRFDKQQLNKTIDELPRRLDSLETKVGQNHQQIVRRLGAIMATQEQVNAALGRIDAATTKSGAAVTAIGDRIAALEQAIKNAGLSAEQEAALLAQLEGVGANAEALAAALEAMGKTPDSPVPVEPPPPVEPV